MKKLIILMACFFSVQASNAQLLDSASHEMARINRVFDSAVFLGFDMTIQYQSDSSGVIKSTDQMLGKYLLNKKNMYYLMGNTEYVQTDSFSYTIYHDEETILMSTSAQSTNGLFPVQSFMDSVMGSFASKYDVYITQFPIEDSTSTHPDDSTYYDKIISFRLKTTAPEYNTANFFHKFDIYYSREDYHPAKFSFSYYDLPEQDPVVISSAYLSNKTIQIYFSAYSHHLSTEVFNDARYTIYNRQRKIYEPSEKYKEYRFLTTGFLNEDEEARYYNVAPWDYNAAN